MLARVADALYWLGRYTERAENVTRLLLVTSDIAEELEGLDDALAQDEWNTVLASLPGAPATLDFSPEAGLSVPYVRALLLDETNPVSVWHSLGRARENARMVREAITQEVFSNLTSAYWELDEARRRGVGDPVLAREIMVRTHRAVMTTLGAMEHTLSRDEGWTVMKLGEAIERTQRTLLVLQAKLPALGAGPRDGDLALAHARWRSLLRSLASLENFRRARGAGLDPDAVKRFLLFSPTTPRSVRCGVVRMKHYLDMLPGDGARATSAGRILGRLLATVTYDDDRVLGASDLGGFLATTVAALNEAHEAIARRYFSV